MHLSVGDNGQNNKIGETRERCPAANDALTEGQNGPLRVERGTGGAALEDGRGKGFMVGGGVPFGTEWGMAAMFARVLPGKGLFRRLRAWVR